MIYATNCNAPLRGAGLCHVRLRRVGATSHDAPAPGDEPLHAPPAHSAPGGAVRHNRTR
ncbi:hypothetical protein GCM10023257_02750 [Streptomyces hyderabadensis]|uniref:Uncharacterized protein n=1 Tax=Streptomyces hyderabadensis TaxID=598549 RepID=A0ABP9HGC6_9ACTN